MGKTEGYKIPLHHQTVYRRPRTQTSRRKLVWVPAIPSWEKEFCYKIGLFEWDKFLQAKRLTKFTHKVLEWNDSAAEKAFNLAKKRFFAQINGLPVHPGDDDQSIASTDPDLYIDEIEWDEDDFIDPGLDGLSAVSDEEEEDYYDTSIEDIKPTGWDSMDVEFSSGKVLTGLIVGS